jgi:hypothetical protein
MSIFNNNKIKILNGLAYEEINSDEHKYRVIFNSYDYDYVEDSELIDQLDQEDYI